jgi:glycosyltransferase involved in cell wall biosynthesis
VRVLLVHNRYRHPGGEERHLDLLSDSLANAGVQVLRLEVDSSSLRTRRSRAWTAAALPYNPISARRVRDFVRKSGAEIVHFHNLWPILTPAALHGAREAGARVVLTLHNFRFACPNGTLIRGGSPHSDCITGSALACGLRSIREQGLRSLGYGLALELQRRLRVLERWVDAFVAPAEFVQIALGQAGFNPRRVQVIRLGVRQTGPVQPRRHEPTHALYVGRLSDEKGIRILLAAAELAPEVPVVIAGSGPLEDTVRQRRPASVTLVGHVDDIELAALRSNSCMSLLPSTCFDVSPYAALEAAAAGVAIVASKIGGIPEIVGDGENGLLVEPGNPCALAHAMKRLWHNRDLAAALGSRAAARAAQQHTLAGAAQEHLRLYHELVAA